MRTSDPAGYDEFFEATSTTTFSHAFRGLHFTTAGTAGVFTVTITLNRSTIATNGVQYNTPTTITKTIDVGVPANSSYLLPISGDRIAVTTRPASGKVFVLI